MASPTTDYRGSKPTDSPKKKKKKKSQYRKSEIKPTIMSLAEKTKPQYSLYRAKAKQTPIQRCLSKKKKKPLI